MIYNIIFYSMIDFLSYICVSKLNFILLILFTYDNSKAASFIIQVLY